LCALCRSESMPPPPAYASWVLGGMLGAVLLVSAGAVVYRAMGSLTEPVPIAVERQGSAPLDATPLEATPPAAPIVEPSSDQPRSGESVPLGEPVPPPAVVALTPPERAPAPAPSAGGGAASSRAARPPPSQAELQAALAATPIVMYSAAWCSVCRKAKRFLTENGLRFQEIDADVTPRGWDKVQALAGRRAVPVIVVDGDVSQGLSPQRIMQAVARSMERRLGITGIAFQQAK
jgi:glutaredoxin